MIPGRFYAKGQSIKFAHTLLVSLSILCSLRRQILSASQLPNPSEELGGRSCSECGTISSSTNELLPLTLPLEIARLPLSLSLLTLSNIPRVAKGLEDCEGSLDPPHETFRATS